MPQKSAICLKLIVVLSTSQTAVALAMIGIDISQVSYTQNFPSA
jgi:hypothetical protein